MVYLKLSVTKNNETENVVKASTLIRNGKQFKIKIKLDGSEPKISFLININKEDHINIYNEKEIQIPFFNSKIAQKL